MQTKHASHQKEKNSFHINLFRFGPQSSYRVFKSIQVGFLSHTLKYS